jgi:hypothetical protein
MPLILGANSLTGGYEVDNSLRFNPSSSDYLRKTFSGSSTNSKKCTMSFWGKRTATGENNRFITADITGSAFRDSLYFTAANEIEFFLNNANNGNLRTNRLFRDVSAWYHIFIVIDTTQATSSNRVKLYVNGVQETSFATASYPALNYDLTGFGNSVEHTIGADDTDGGSNEFFNGYMSEINFIDGQALAPSDFGEFDQDTGIWKPIAYTGTYGTNGFYLEFKDSSALGDDTSGNGNDFTVNNLTSIDQTTDTPTNNFATLNPLNIDPALSYTFSNGNLDVSIAESGGEGMTSSTLSVSQGKWYWECKLVTSSAHGRFGVVPTSIGATGNPGEFGIAWQMNDATMQLVNTVVSGSWGSNPSNNDILMFALDCDNQAFYFGVNGTWRNSGSPTSGASKTGGVDYSGESTLTSDFLTIGFGGNFFGNFGNPPFTISSGNSDANGYGNFEYAVPSGYYALNSKNLAEYG